MTNARFIESLRMEEGTLHHTSWHEQRMTRTLQSVFGCCPFDFRFADVSIPEEYRHGVVKCRVVYGERIESVEFAPYTPKEIHSLRLVEAPDEMDYHLKYTDRSALNALRERRGTCSDILIVHRGQLTDTSYSNIVFDDGERLVTPSTPLLNGTCRQRLLQEGLITAEPLTPDDLPRFRRAILINALLGLDAGVSLSVADIR